jgi:protein disulfide-isomerase
MKKVLVSMVMGWLALQVSAAELSWMTDFLEAKRKARDEKKMLLLDFTGSDWCGWCIRLNKEVFHTKEFADYAKDNLVLVEVDFPRRKQLAETQQKANQKLAEKHRVSGFPTIVVLDGEGKELWTQRGYMGGGQKAWIAKLDELKKK